MHQLINELFNNPSEYNINRFYKRFSTLPSKDGFKTPQNLLKVLDLIEKKVISKKILFIHLLQARNVNLINDLLSIQYDNNSALDLDKALENSGYLFEYSVTKKLHWISDLWKTSSPSLPKDISEKFAYLQVIYLTNQEFNYEELNNVIRNCRECNLDNFWIFYVKEIEFLLKIYNNLKCINSNIDPLDFLNFASKESLLGTLSKFLSTTDELSEIKIYNEIIKAPHTEDFEQQKIHLDCFCILKNFFKLIQPNKIENISSIIETIKKQFFSIPSEKLKIELLHLLFASIFIKQNNEFICNQKELQAILFILKLFTEQLKFNNVTAINDLYMMVTDAVWRLELVLNTVKLKEQENILNYMLASPESLINCCLKNRDFNRAIQIIKLWNLEFSCLGQEVIHIEKLNNELIRNIQKSFKIRKFNEDFNNEDAVTLPNESIGEIIEEFFKENSTSICDDCEEILEKNLHLYDFLSTFLSNNDIYMDILDITICYSNTINEAKELFDLSKEFTDQKISQSFLNNLLDNNEDNSESLHELILNPDTDFTLKNETEISNNFLKELAEFYDEFYKSLSIVDEGVLNKDHPSHAILQKISNLIIESENTKYLKKLFNYLKAFSKVLYIEKNTSQIILKNRNCSYFELLKHNRSELMGKLLFEFKLEPQEFERYFSKLKLDFLYHVAGNCFPTVNLYSNVNVNIEELYHENVLYPPTKSVISYVKKRNWLLALLLSEMYGMESVEFEMGESRIQTFINYLNLPKIQYLQNLFQENEITTALNHEISYQKLNNFIHSEIGRYQSDLIPSSSWEEGNLNVSLESGLEIDEKKLRTINWLKMYHIIDSLSEMHFINEPKFITLKDMALTHLVKDSFECEYYKYYLNITNAEIRRNLLLENLTVWPINFCIESIQTELSSFFEDSLKNDDTLLELKIWLQYLDHSKNVMIVLDILDLSWSKFYDLCAKSSKEIMNKFFSKNETDLLIEFLDFHELPESFLLNIDEEFVERILNDHDNFSTLKKLLKVAPNDHIYNNLCYKLLSTIKDVKNLQLVTEFLIENTPTKELLNIHLSLQILSSTIPLNDFNEEFLTLLKNPLSILEVFIMNMELDYVSSAIRIIREQEMTELLEEIDELLRKYAEKTLEFRIVTTTKNNDQNPSQNLENRILQSFDSIDFLHLDGISSFLMPEEIPKKAEWVPNGDAKNCMCCKTTTFSMFNRRHHCRRCGRVVCYSCSKRRMMVPSYGNILVRVCQDCWNQTKSGMENDSLCTSTTNIYWMLNDDADHNRIVREEFSYEFSPSVNLCLSLMQFHSKNDQYFDFLLNQCESLTKLLMVSNQNQQDEIDYSLVIRILKCLALAAKISNIKNRPIDTILQQTDILSLLVERGCLQLLPHVKEKPSLFFTDISLMRLRDRLLEDEQWNLALEVSTKAGLDQSCVFVSWGLSYLKSRNLKMARNKFAKYFDRTFAGSDLSKNALLLEKVVNALESINEGEENSNSQLLLARLRSLKSIEMGHYPSKSHNLSDEIYNECDYYLNKYGTGTSLVEFHVKHGQFKRALKCLIDKKLPSVVFVNLYVQCLKDGKINLLQEAMSTLDYTLDIWTEYIMNSCKYLANRNYLNTLYNLQLFIGDYVRASITCIKFYENCSRSFNDFRNNAQYLKDALNHLLQAKDQEQWVTVNSNEYNSFEQTGIISDNLVVKMPNEEIEKNCVTILLQIDVVEFLCKCDMNDNVDVLNIYLDKLRIKPRNCPDDHKVSLPTLFGNDNEKKFIAVLCIVCAENIEEGVKYALRVAKECKQMKPVKIYKECGRYFAQSNNIGLIIQLVKSIRKYHENDTFDEVLLYSVVILFKNDSKINVDELIKLISDKDVKISACIEANKLNNAYFLASKYKRMVDIKRIMLKAENLNLQDIRKMCLNFLQKNTTSTTSAD